MIENIEENNTPKKKTVFQYALRVALGIIPSRILGFLREILIISFFPRYVTDIFFVGLRLPNMFRRLLGEGALSASFIPVFIDVKTHQSPEEAKNFASSFYTLLVSVLSILIIAAIIGMEPILNLLLSGEGFRSIPGKFETAVYFARIMFSFLFFVSSYAYFMAILNSYNIFGLPALAPAFLNLSLIIACLLPSSIFSIEGEVLAWGFLFGGLVQFAILIPKIAQLGYLPKLSFAWNSKPVKKVLTTLIPSLIGLGVLQLTGLINISFASRLAQGAHSYIYLADRIIELPLSLFTVSIGTALLPTLSSLWSSGKVDQMRDTTAQNLRLLYFISIPSAFGIWFLAKPITECLFQHSSKFTNDEVIITSQIVQIYAFTLLSASMVRVLAPSFYAIKNTWLPATTAGLSLIFHYFLASSLIESQGLNGLVTSTVSSSFFNMTLLLVSYHFFIGSLKIFTLVKSLITFTICSCIIILTTKLYDPLQQLINFNSSQLSLEISRFSALFTVIIISAAGYFLLAYLFKIEEFREIVRLRRRR